MTITNTSGQNVTDLSDLEITFIYGGALASSGGVWGAPYIGWNIAQNGNATTLTGGTTEATWANGAAITLGFTPLAAGPTNEHIYRVVRPALKAANVQITEHNGAVAIVNTSGAPIPLRAVELDFKYAAPATDPSGSPFNWTETGNSSAGYALAGGTQDSTQLAVGATLNVSFTPITGVSATNLVFKAEIGGPPPAATPQPVVTPSPVGTPLTPPAPAPSCLPHPQAANTSCLIQTITMYGGEVNPVVAYTQIHNGLAAGTGTYLDPVTFASDPAFFMPGATIYIPFLAKYFIMEDLCPGCSGTEHVDLWMGGTVSNTPLLNCANALSGHEIDIIENPPFGYAVNTTPIWDGTHCFTPAALPPSPPYLPLSNGLRRRL